MPAVIRLNKQGLNDLINNIKENGGDTTILDNLMSEVNDDERSRRPVRRETSLRLLVEEPTTAERLEAEVGELFPGGMITEKILAECIEMDAKYTLEELRNKCREAGLSLSGDKKELAAKLIAGGVA